ncbi:UNVERIFIED_CONTAM: hypothetical protein Sradi_0710600 [Sesamum radiatum]|uniref:Integrase zinc-binding domain-containing protein n=1 Tax=Sesamum radiatum TaxID=300843 RepID=A0AAW2VRE0_SESRA
MQLGDVSFEKVNTSLYGFAREVVHPWDMISLPLKMGAGATRKTCVLKFLVVDVPFAYNVILGRPTLNAFQAVFLIYHMKIKFPTLGGVGKVQSDHLQSRKCYIEAVRKGQKRNLDEGHERVPPSKKRKEAIAEGAPEEVEVPAKVQPVEELLNIEITPGTPDKTTRIGSHLERKIKEEIILCLQLNADIFAWEPQDLEGIDPPQEARALLAVQPIRTGEDWRGPIIRWIEEGHLPDDRWEATRLKTRVACFMIQGGTLYERSYTHPLLRCLSTKEGVHVLEEIHSRWCGAHAGTWTLANKALRAGYFWPTMKQDAKHLVSKCKRCQKHFSLIHQLAEPLTTMLSPCPFTQSGMDIIGPFPVASGQRKFLLVAINYFTK